MLVHRSSQSDLQGHVAIVTGAGRGIGRGIARTLAERGVRVACNDLDAASAAGAAEELGLADLVAVAVPGDVSRQGVAEKIVERVVQEWGQVDILVNNAGINDSTPILELTLETWERVLAVNLTSMLLCSQAVAPHMIEQGYGRIINMSSTSGHFGAPNLCAYATSKAGVLGLTRVMAVEWGPLGITANAICPGNIDTEMLRGVLKRRGRVQGGITTEAVVARVVDRTPAGRLGTVEDVASLVAYLALPEAGYINGQAIKICGGRSANLS